MTYAYGTKLVGGARPNLTGAPSRGPTLPTVFLGGLPVLYGEAVFTEDGDYTWTVPRNVYAVSVVCVGGGNGAGSLVTSSGTSHFNNSLYAFGSDDRTGGGFAGADGGGVGGLGGLSDSSVSTDGLFTVRAGGGGGGAGGYCGGGGGGGDAITLPAGISTSQSGGGGGGVGLFGLGGSGVGGESSNVNLNGGDALGGGGGGGSGGRNTTVRDPGDRGTGGSGGTPETSSQARTAGVYGGGDGGTTNNGDGGGGLGWKNNIRVNPGQQIPIKVGTDGAVRIIWGTGRTFPVNAQ